MRIEAERYGGVCSCGGEHRMATQLCVIESGAMAGFETYMDEIGAAGKRCAVYDNHTYYAAGLRRPAAEQEIVLEAEGLHANEVSTAEVLRRLDPDVKILIAVVVGALLLTLLYTLFNTTIMPTVSTKITELFGYTG